MSPIVFAFIHHLAVLLMFACLFYEHLAVKPNINEEIVKQLTRIDLVYGLCAACVLMAGLLRVFIFEKTASFYMYNWAFYLKMGLFLLVALLSIHPTLSFLRWREQLKNGEEVSVSHKQAKKISMLIRAELLLISLMLPPAVIMAKGYGYLG